MKTFLFLSLVALSTSRMAYVLPDGFLEILGGDPNTVFSCEGLPYGYYADTANGCRIFHVCHPMMDEAGNVLQTDQFSFICGNQTIFSQESLTCNHPQDAFPCEQAESLYEISNSEFGRIPEQNL